MKQFKLFGLMIFALGLFFASCGDDDDDTTTEVCYTCLFDATSSNCGVDICDGVVTYNSACTPNNEVTYTDGTNASIKATFEAAGWTCQEQ